MEGRHPLKISAVAAHHGPASAFQTIKLDRACLGSILKVPKTLMARKRVYGVSRNATFLPSKQAHALSCRGKFPPPFFCFDGYGLTQNLSGNKIIGEIRTKTCISTPMPPFW
jgi:hypothetical protein